MRHLDLVNKRFGSWSVKDRHSYSEKGHSFLWSCVCDCGTKATVLGSNLTSGKSLSCGGNKHLTETRQRFKEERESLFKDLSGEKFGSLTALYANHISQNGARNYYCQCDCGNFRVARGSRLKNKEITDCGCKRNRNFALDKAHKAATKHGLCSKEKAHPIYKAFDSMKRRCLYSTAANYKDYGGRGITICDEWLKNPIEFYSWSSINGWKEGLSIDRINVDGNYEPGNCRWATTAEQASNRRTTLKLKYNNKLICPSKIWVDIKDKSVVSYSTFLSRVLSGWTIKDAAWTQIYQKRMR